MTSLTGANAVPGPEWVANPYDPRSGVIMVVWRSVSEVPAVPLEASSAVCAVGCVVVSEVAPEET